MIRAQIFIILVLCGISTAHAEIKWQWVNPTPQGNTLNAVAYNGTNQYVAVGDFGTVMTSADSYTWVNGVSGTTSALNDVVWNGTEYLAVGDPATVLKSTDGLTWSASTVGSATLPLNGVVWDGTQYVVVGNLGKIHTSADGVSWATQTTGILTKLTDVIWTGTQYVVVGNSGLVLTSLNAMTWTQQTTPLSNSLHAIAWDGTMLVAVGISGATITSTDGVTWASAGTLSNHLWDVAWDGTTFLTISSGGQYYASTDGNWGAAVFNGETSSTMRSIFPALNGWVSVGIGGWIYTSLDGVSWTQRFSGVKDHIKALANNGVTEVALGSKCAFMTSADGVSWTTYPSAMIASSFCYDVVWAAGLSKFIATTTVGFPRTGNIYSSTDGVTWVHLSSTGPTIGAKLSYSPTAGFVAVGTPDNATGEIWHSADGITWAMQAVANPLKDVAWLNNQFVTVGNSGTILTSADGTTWTTQVSGTSATLALVAANATTYMVSGALNTVLTSADTVSWFSQTTGLGNAITSWSGGLVWTGNQFMLSGSLGGSPLIATSVDGVIWEGGNLITSTFLGAVDVFAGQVLAGGNYGTLISGVNIDVVTTISAGATEVTEGGATDSFNMELTSAPSADVVITLSTDLQVTFTPAQMTFTPLNWNTAQTITITAVDDAIVEPTANILITPSVVSLDTRYDALVVPDIAITVIDNDAPAVTITQSGGSTAVIEGGATDSYDMVLATMPTANVDIGINIGSAQVTTDVNTLTFTALNWNAPQTVTITAVDDAVVESAHNDSISHTVTSSDLNYHGLATPALSTIAIEDNDVGSVLITESGGSTDISEDGANDSFVVVLGMQPSVNVTVRALPNYLNQCTVNQGILTFTSNNWNVPQTVVVSAVDDGDVEGNHLCGITTSTSSAVVGYHFLSVPNVNANVTDNDFIGVTLSESGGSTDVAEAGATDSYDVVLNSMPSADVTVNIAANAQVTIDVASLVFTPTNWNTPQAVTVTAVDDGVVEGAHVGSVSHTITSTDPGYSGFTVADVAVNITDKPAPSPDDTAGNASGSGGGGSCIVPTSSSMPQMLLLLGVLAFGCLLLRRRKDL